MSKIEGLFRIVLSMACSTASWNDARSYGQLLPLPVPAGRPHELEDGGGGVGVGVVGGLGAGAAGGGVGVGTGTGTTSTGTGAGPIVDGLLGGSSSVIVWHERPNRPSTAAATSFRSIDPSARNWLRIVSVIGCHRKTNLRVFDPLEGPVRLPDDPCPALRRTPPQRRSPRPCPGWPRPWRSERASGWRPGSSTTTTSWTASSTGGAPPGGGGPGRST